MSMTDKSLFIFDYFKTIAFTTLFHVSIFVHVERSRPILEGFFSHVQQLHLTITNIYIYIFIYLQLNFLTSISLLLFARMIE